MIVKVPHVGDVEMDTLEAVHLADDIRARLGVEIPLSMRNSAYTRDDPETGEPLPRGVRGFYPRHLLEAAERDVKPPAERQWPEYVRVDPDLRTDRDVQGGAR